MRRNPKTQEDKALVVRVAAIIVKVTGVSTPAAVKLARKAIVR